jgi:hypothetical protein
MFSRWGSRLQCFTLIVDILLQDGQSFREKYWVEVASYAFAAFAALLALRLGIMEPGNVLRRFGWKFLVNDSECLLICTTNHY